jgi:hypothetical protein
MERWWIMHRASSLFLTFNFSLLETFGVFSQSLRHLRYTMWVPGCTGSSHGDKNHEHSEEIEL